MAIKPITGYNITVNHEGSDLFASIETGTKTKELVLVCDETRQIRKGDRISLKEKKSGRIVEVLTTEDVQIFKRFDEFFNAAMPIHTFCPGMEEQQAYLFYFKLAGKFLDNSREFGLLNFELPAKVNQVASQVISSNRNPKNREESKTPKDSSAMFAQAPLQKRKTVQHPEVRVENYVNYQLPSDQSSFSTVKKSVGPRKNAAS